MGEGAFCHETESDLFLLLEMRLLSILLIKSNLKWCRHFSRSLFLYFNYLVSVTAG